MQFTVTELFHSEYNNKALESGKYDDKGGFLSMLAETLTCKEWVEVSRD